MRAFVVAGSAVLVSLGALFACSGNSSNDIPSDARTADAAATTPAPGNGSGRGNGSESDPSGNGNGNGDGDDGDAQTPKDAGTTFCQKTFGASIDKTDACCSATDKTTNDYKSIMASYGNAQKGCGISLDGSLAKRRIGYDAKAAGDCMSAFDAALAAQTCDGERFGALDTMNTPACRKVIVGKQAAGAPCAADYECVDGLTCLADKGAKEGTCSPPPPVGKACGGPRSGVLNLKFGSHRACASGAHCDPFKLVCTAPSSGQCDNDQDCGDGELCIGHKCTQRGKLGDKCQYPTHCEPGLYCDGFTDVQVGTCARKKAAGEACAPGYAECKGLCPDVDGGTKCAAFCGSN